MGPVAQIAKIVRPARESLGWTQEALAQEAGVSRDTVVRAEMDGKRNLSVAKLDMMFVALGLETPKKLFDALKKLEPKE